MPNMPPVYSNLPLSLPVHFDRSTSKQKENKACQAISRGI